MPKAQWQIPFALGIQHWAFGIAYLFFDARLLSRAARG